MESTSDNAPDRALPPIKSSSLQRNAHLTARAAAVHASEAFDPKPRQQPVPRPARRVETTLGALSAQLSEGLLEEQEFDPAAYLRQTTQTGVPRTGASLAAAALKRLGGKR